MIQAAAKRVVELYGGDVVIYMDGSADEGYLDTGSATVIYLSPNGPFPHGVYSKAWSSFHFLIWRERRM